MTKKLLEPIEIHGMRLKNRVGFGPILGMPVDPEGFVNSETVRWFEERARGEVGFIMSGTLVPLPPDAIAKNAPVMPETGACIYDDKYIPGWAKLIDVIHSYDVKIGGQVAAPGPMMGEGPSSSPFPDEQSARFGIFDLMAGTILPVDEISFERMEAIKRFLTAAAGRVKAAGFDCVELHCAHGGANLHASFLSPYYNRRTDQYGGNWENRLRFIVETIEAIRQVVGRDYPLLVRFSADDLLGERGITLEASVKYIVPALEKAGVDAIDVSQGSVLHSIEGISIPLYYPRGCFIENSAAIKKATSLPVIGVGRIVDLDMAEQFLKQGKADVIYLASQLGADPETPKKYFEGRSNETRKCIGCKPILCSTPCTLNYDSEVGRIPLTPAKTPKKVLIIGGGVGGMEAARISAMRGHQVTLMEREPELGGIVAALGRTKLMSEFKNIIAFLGTQMRKLNVDVRVCKEATTADVDDIKPDVIIIACGSSMVIPEIAKDKPGVMDHIHACREPEAVGQRVVIWGLVAAELALSMAQEGKEVTLIGSGDKTTLGGAWVEGSRQLYIWKKLTDMPLARETPESERVQNPQVLYGANLEEVTPEGVRIRDKDGSEKILPYDTLIVSRLRVPNKSLFEALEGKVKEVYKIGDCDKVRNIKNAIWTANEVARKI
ncbi:MAG: FAD-dependent oxidoreductase [Deltaproteobacteria bacterium]|nr:FAD-dependent oxidoreductase [Deltaproteobacteria bacterium]